MHPVRFSDQSPIPTQSPRVSFGNIIQPNMYFPPYMIPTRAQVRETLDLAKNTTTKARAVELMETLPQKIKRFLRVFNVSLPEAMSYGLKEGEQQYLNRLIDIMDKNKLTKIKVHAPIHENDWNTNEEDLVSHFHTATIERCSEGLKIKGLDNEPVSLHPNTGQSSSKTCLIYNQGTGRCLDSSSRRDAQGVITVSEFNHMKGFMALVDTLFPAFSNPEGVLKSGKPAVASVAVFETDGKQKVFQLGPKYNEDYSERQLGPVLDNLKLATMDYLKTCGIQPLNY
jgi:hypothetical protein